MRIGARQSIRKTLMLLLLFTAGASLVLATLGFAINDWVYHRTEMYDRLKAQAGIIGNNSVAALTFQDAASAAKTLVSLKSETTIVGAALYSVQGQIFATYERFPKALPATPPADESGVIEDQLYVLLPIEFDGEQIGQILVLSSHDYWQQQLVPLATVVGLFLVSFFLALLLSSRLHRVVTGPILKLADTARRITESKDYSLRAERLSKDEIGLLVDDFNEMVHQIQLRDIELRQVKQALEDKVEERTAELAKLAREFEYQAYHDELTDLANRKTFDRQLQSSIIHTRRHGGQLAVIFLDLDRFKMINDSLGHAIGDRLLIEIAQRLSGCLRETDTLSRLGGDEFAVLLTDIDTSGIAQVASKLIHTINEPITVEGYNLHVSTSIGISVFPDDGDNADAILKNADTAMYRSKDQGRNRFTFYAPEMNARAERRLVLENRLRTAIEGNHLYLHYQPKWDVHGLQMVGVEALVRWFDPDEGFISPGEFIPLAEECGLIADIDLWVMETACREILHLYKGRCPDIALSVNYSPLHFLRREAAQDIARILSTTGFPGTRLELEITENLVGPEGAGIFAQLNAIRDLGVEISIDDFGTAYSSLSRLKQLPINTLKIDRSFVRDLGKDPDDEVLVRTIITMAHNLSLKVVAEGVETDNQFQFVKEYNCDIVQGFRFGKPMPLADLERMVATPARVPV